MTVLVNIFKIAILFDYLNIVLSEEKIIIIGAGASGIAAASKLLENGIEDILILEAESRLGGRIATLSLDGTKIDLGAQWCDGQAGNVIYEKLKNLNLVDLTKREYFPKQFYFSSRTIISSDFSEELLKTFSEADKYRNGSEENLGIALKRRYNELISRKYSNHPKKLQIAHLAETYLEHLSVRVGGASSWYDVAAFDPEQFTRVGHALGWKNGYSMFLDVLMKKYPDPKNQLAIEDKIHLNKEVTKITFDETNTSITPINVLCSDGSTYTAKHVIFTASLGVLKSTAESLFEPSLSETKIKAIKNIGYGSSLKVFISFDTKWWGNLSGFNLLWSEEDKASSRNRFPYGPKNQKGESWIVEHYYIYSMPDSNILLVYFSGHTVRQIEVMDENILKDGIHFTLKLFLGHIYDIPRPQKLIRSNWYSNVHFRGVNSFPYLNTTGEDRRNLQSPIKNSIGQPIVQFGGEATSVRLYASVQGAVESGYREADRLIELYKK